MKLTISEPKFLTDSISIISELVNEVRFKLDPDKIELIAMDPANVSMVIFRLLSSAFTEYKIDSATEISINLDQFKQVLKRAKPSDILIMELDKEKNKLKLQLKGDSVRTFHLPLISIEDKEQKIPNLDFPLKISTSTLIFDEAVEDLGIFAESVALTVEKNKLTLDSESNQQAGKIEITGGAQTKIETSAKDKVTSKYSLEYLKKMIKASKLTNNVTLQFSKDYPLKIEYLVKDKLSLQFILAPRISND